MIEIDPQLARVARDDIPEQHTHVLWASSAPSGRFAIVMLTTGEGSAMQFDQTVAERVGSELAGAMSGTPSSVIYAGDHRAATLCN